MVCAAVQLASSRQQSDRLGHALPAAASDPAPLASCWLLSGSVMCPHSLVQPIALGADLVIHSATKYLGGHHDLLAGAVAGAGYGNGWGAAGSEQDCSETAKGLACLAEVQCPGAGARCLHRVACSSSCPACPTRLPPGRSDLVAAVRDMHSMLGAVLDPHAAFLLLRGMKTLEVRLTRQNATALELARRLEAHPQVTAAGDEIGRASWDASWASHSAMKVCIEASAATASHLLSSCSPERLCACGIASSCTLTLSPSSSPPPPLPQIARVHYPGLESHPDYAVAARQMSGFGGVVSFEVAGDLWATAKLIDALRLPYIAPSLGGVESLVEQPAVIRFVQTADARCPMVAACAGGSMRCLWLRIPGASVVGDAAAETPGKRTNGHAMRQRISMGEARQMLCVPCVRSGA